MRRVVFRLTVLLLFMLSVSVSAEVISDGLVIHLEANAITNIEDGGSVSLWSDLSGQNNNGTQATSSSQPVYIAQSVDFGNNAAVQFDGTNDYINLPSGSSCPINVTSFTVLMVAKYDVITFQDIISAQGSSGNDRIRMQIDTAISGSPFHWMAGTSKWKAIQSASDTDVHVFGITSTVEGFLDGVSITTASSTASTTDIPSDFVLGAAAGGANGFLSGAIAEVVVYNRVLTATEILDMSDYFNSKYLLDDPAPAVKAGPDYAIWMDYLPYTVTGSVLDDNVALDGISWEIVSSPESSSPVLTPMTTDQYAPKAEFSTDMTGKYVVALTANDQHGQAVTDTAAINVVSDACAAAQLLSSWEGFSKYDTNEDCIMDIADFADFTIEWLDDFSLPAPAPLEFNGSITIALIGDSTVCNWDASSAKRGWGQYIGEFFIPSVTIVNNAKSGRSTKTFIEEGLWEDTLAINPDYVLIQFGHNDSHDPVYPESTDAETDYKEYLRQYIDESRAIGAAPVLITPMYRRYFDDLGNLVDNLVPYANAMRDVAIEKDVPIVELNAASAELYLQLGEDGSLALASTSTDPTHFNEAGARAMVELVIEQLPEVEPGLETYTK